MSHMKKEYLVSDYFDESLQKLLNNLEKTPPIGAFLSNHPELTPADRDQVVEEMVSLSESWGASIQALQLSVNILDRFTCSEVVTRSVFRLVGVLSLVIALKYHDVNIVEIQRVMKQTRNAFSLDNIIHSEFYIFKKIEPLLKYPTAAEFVRHLIYATKVNYDFTKVIDRSDRFCLIFYEDYSLVMFSPLTVAIVSTICALEQYKQQKFRNQWLRFLFKNDNLKLDVDVLDECKRHLLRKLRRNTLMQEGNLLQCLEENTIQSIMNSIIKR